MVMPKKRFDIPPFEKFEPPQVIVKPDRPKRTTGEQKLVDYVGIFLEDELEVEVELDGPSINEIMAAAQRYTECGASIKIRFKNLLEPLLVGHVGATEFWSDEWNSDGNAARVYHMSDPGFFSKILEETHQRIAERVTEDMMVYGEHAAMPKFKGSDNVKS